MIKWIRPCGREITTNETKASIAYAKEHDWEREGEKFVNVIEVEMGHEQTIKTLSTKEAIKGYCKDVHGVKIDARGSMEVVKEKSIKAVTEWLQSQKS